LLSPDINQYSLYAKRIAALILYPRLEIKREAS